MLPDGAAIAKALDDLQVAALTNGLAAEEHAGLAWCATPMHQTPAYVNAFYASFLALHFRPIFASSPLKTAQLSAGGTPAHTVPASLPSWNSENSNIRVSTKPGQLQLPILLLALIAALGLSASGRSTASHTHIVGLWALVAGVTTAAVLLLNTRRLRAVGPIVFA